MDRALGGWRPDRGDLRPAVRNQWGGPIVQCSKNDTREFLSMRSSHPPPPSKAAIVMHQLHRFFMSFPIVCFTLALLTDVAYWQTSFLMWHDFSSWLLLAGLVGGVMALIAGLVGLLAGARSLPWLYWLGVLVAFALAIVNSLVHAGDGWTAIVPTGLALSTATVVVMLATAWVGRTTVSVAGLQRHA
jgi:uncharacterized membrane protein